MSDKISFILCKDEKMIKEMMEFIKTKPEITKQEIYAKFSRKNTDYFWKFLHVINDRISANIDKIDEEIKDMDIEIKNLFSFQKVKSRVSNKEIWQVKRNYTIKTFQIDDISGFEVVLR